MNKVLGGLIFVICLCILQNFSGLLELDRQQVLSGQIWRIWTGHLVHTNLLHLWLNILAALVIYIAFFSKIKLLELLGYSVIFSALISLGLLSLYPQLEWYNGLSGVLHALVVYFSIRMIRDGEAVYWLGPVILWVKVLTETARAHMGFLYQISDMNVITEAHVIGVVIGTIMAICGLTRWQRAIVRPTPS